MEDVFEKEYVKNCVPNIFQIIYNVFSLENENKKNKNRIIF